jgi:tripartite ATP-independent transporter DctP family solute receptor
MRVIAFLMLFCLIAVNSAQAGTVLYLAHANKNDPTDIPTAAAAVAFKRAVERDSGGDLRVEIFPEGQLGNDGDAVQLTRKGIIQSAIVSVGGVKGVYPKIAVLDYPFAWETLEQTYRVFDGPFMDTLRHDFAQHAGLNLVGFADTGGLFVITNNRHAIRSPADMTGLRIRTMGVATHKELVRALGAEPVEVPWSEITPALRNGVVDGQMNPPSIIRFGKLNEVQRHLTVTNHLYTPYPWVMNADFMAGLSEAQRRVVENAIHEGIVASRELSTARRDDIAALASTMAVRTQSPAEREAFRKLTQPVMEQFLLKTFGAESAALLQQMKQAIAATKSQSR